MEAIESLRNKRRSADIEATLERIPKFHRNLKRVENGLIVTKEEATISY